MHLVTGGAGFIGSNLVQALSERGEEVVVCDRLGSGAKWRNLRGAVLAGLVPPEGLEDWLAGSPPLRSVVHLGAVSETTATDGDLVARSNLGLTLRLWELCAARGVPLLYASSAATYGDGSRGFEDDASPGALARLEPLSLYGWSKHAADRRVAQVLALGRPAPPRWMGLKFFNVYGPREGHKGRMSSVVLHKWRETRDGAPATLFESDVEGLAHGEQRRDFVHVDDAVAAMLWWLEGERPSGLFNLGTGRARSFNDLVRALAAARGRPAEIRYAPMPGDLRGRYQSFTEARMGRLRAAGLDRPPTGLEEGVASYAAWLEREEGA